MMLEAAANWKHDLTLTSGAPSAAAVESPVLRRYINASLITITELPASVCVDWFVLPAAARNFASGSNRLQRATAPLVVRLRV